MIIQVDTMGVMPKPKRADRLRRHIDLSLETKGHGSLDALVREERLQGQSWDDIAFTVEGASDERVSGQSLRNWYPQYNLTVDELTASLKV